MALSDEFQRGMYGNPPSLLLTWQRGETLRVLALLLPPED